MVGRRVLILLQNEPVPSDRHVWNQSTALARAGYDVTVVCPTGERARPQQPSSEIDGVTIHRYEPRRADERVIGYALEYLAALWSIRRLARRLARERPFDIVHACSPPDFLLLAALGLRRRGRPIRLRPPRPHAGALPDPLRRRACCTGVTLIAEQVAFRSADVVLSVNDSYRRVAIERGRRDPADVAVVRTGPDLKRFVPSEPDPSLKRGKRFLLSYAGVMGPQDGVDHALLALAELQQAARRLARRLHGRRRRSSTRCASWRASWGSTDCVEFTGWVEHETISRVLSSSDVCLAPDPKNPLNDVSSMVKISEYMAMSRPIVSYDLAESRFGAGEAAVFAASGRPRGLRAAGLGSARRPRPPRRDGRGRPRPRRRAS